LTVCPQQKEAQKMVKKTNKNIAVEIDKTNESETPVILDYSSSLLPQRRTKSNDNLPNDDLIVSLSDAYENKRARQVFEWEQARRQVTQRAA
jgi:hypothetical protein